MIGNGPNAPFLATAPLNAEPRRRRRWLLPAALAATVLAVAALTVLIGVPVAQSVPENLTLINSGSLLSAVGQTVSFPHGGTLELSWWTASGRSVTFSVLAPSGSTIYSSDSARGSASLGVGDSGPYTLEIYDLLPETVTVSGTLHYSAPML
ncbi:MAG: hypothetical protein ACLQD8_05710 [Thermoplasmata archaeon]